MAHLLDALNDHVLLADGAIGTTVMALDLDVEKDFHGHENLYNYLVRSRPDVLRKIHQDYIVAGAEVFQPMVFGATPSVLNEFGLGDQAFDLNKENTELVLEVFEEFKGDGRDRFVVGPLGPGTKLPSLGQIDFDTLEDDYVSQCDGLIAGGIDALFIQTCQDPLQTKAAIKGAERSRQKAGVDTPILAMVTMETTGSMLVGTDIAAVSAVVEPFDVPLMGLNCATGPREMEPHVAWLGEHWRGHIAIMPNAGLPELFEGRTRYPLTPAELAEWQERFIEKYEVSMVGGCCGTDDSHTAALDAMLRRRAGNGARRPVRARRTHHQVPALASLFAPVPLAPEAAPLRIGEGCVAPDNETFRAAVEAGDWDGCVALARAQEKAGTQVLSLGFAGQGRDETADMEAFVARLRGTVNAAISLNADDPAALEAALKLYGGKPMVGGVDFAGGSDGAGQRLALARRFGAAAMGRLIDEDGPALDADAALGIARRLYDLACGEHELAPADLMIEVPTWPLASAAGRASAAPTLDAIEAVAKEFPECRTVVSLSALSAGLDTPVRQVVEAVFVEHASERGLAAFITDVSAIQPAAELGPIERRAAEDLIFARQRDGRDALDALARLSAARPAAADETEAPLSLDDRLRARIVEGNRKGLEEDLAEAVAERPALDIINDTLLDGMKTVSELFSDGKMPLPFVLEAAETMKAAVTWLEPHMDTKEGMTRGTIVLATVKGDIHDIGKNLVDIILSNNGYRTVNLGAKQPIEAIMAAAREEEADAVGMSGLLIRSAVVMRENLEEMRRGGLSLPVLLGGAALNRAYVQDDCMRAYGPGTVAYAGDVFDGLELMDKVVAGELEDHLAETQDTGRGWPSNRPPGRGGPAEQKPPRPVELEEIRLRRTELHTGLEVPVPPFWGSQQLQPPSLQTLLPLLNERVLFQFQWGFRKGGRTLEQWRTWADQEVRPILDRITRQCIADEVLHPEAVYGYWKCAAEGDAVLLFDEDGQTEVARFSFPRQQRTDGLCIADFIRDAGADGRDVIGLQAVTVGQEASDSVRSHFDNDRYQDYLYLHGFSVEMAEALAEYVHQRIRSELGFGGDDAEDRETLLRQGYRGARFSFGFPACPRLEDQAQILELLGAGRIGVSMSDEHQLHPELSTTALIAHHPQARYFSV